jgi:autophagy-related protein 11
VYNRQVIQAATSSPKSTSQIPMLSPYKVDSPPDTISDQNDLQAWRDLFSARRSWALKLVNDCAKMSDTAQQRYSETDIITRSVGAAVTNLQTHVQGLDQKCADARNWASEVSKDHQSLISGYEGSLAQLREIPATAPMVRFIMGRDPRRGKSKACLEDLIDVEEVKKAGATAQRAAANFDRSVAELGNIVDSLVADTDKVLEKAENGAAKSAFQRSSESVQLMEDIEAISKKVNSDYESVLSYPNTPKFVSQASKSALLHTKNFLPNLSKRSQEMDGILRYATEKRNMAATESAEIMQAVASLNSTCTEVTERLESLEVASEDEKAFGLLQLVQQMPAIYASFVAEAIRRREWNEKIKSDSSTLANEMAAFQDEEERRRKKWQKSTGALFWADRTERKAMGLEVNLLGDDEQWPQASRRDLEELIDALQSQNSKQELITEASQILSELNNPTKQQSKRAKAFKAGSFHEAALGRSTLLGRGDDLIRGLQDEKARIETKLKGAESRVRRLEDLLHRQSVASRSSTRDVFQAPASPNPDRQDLSNATIPSHINDQSRRSSVSSRRFSANQGAEEKAIAQKLLSLEAELIAERERSAGLEKEVSARTTTTNNIKGQIEEANSTKNDLMKNLEAQKREFATERMSLESEIKRLKTRIEEYEDDMDRIVESRENEKANIDERVRALQQELEKHREESTAESQKAQGQVDFLRNDAKLQRESNENLERQLLAAREESRALRARVERSEAAEAEQLESLHSLHALLMPETTIPTELNILVEGLLGKSRYLLAELHNLRHHLAVVQSDRDTAETSLSELRVEIAAVREKLSVEEIDAFQLRESLGAEKAKLSALQAELADEREQLTHLRAKFAEGETGSEALRSRVEEEERKVAMLVAELAAKRSQVGSLEEELRSVQERLQTSQGKFEGISSRLEGRTMRAKDLTQRLYAQNDRLLRLLDRLSYSVTREGSSMAIQKIPRTERTSVNDSSDPGSSMRKSLSGTAPRKAMADSGDLELLYWMQVEDPESESEKYEAYLKAVGYFDVEAFCETITRRVKELEHAARKYTKDARAYREKSHHAQKEAHEKIAFKNFKEGDLALFLPTRNQTAGAWAAFNVGAPHYFLREQDSHKLRTRDWLLARIHKIEDRVVDLSKSMTAHHSITGDRGSIGEASNGGDSFEDDNPFDLSDGLRWYLIDAVEEKPGAPTTPGLGKTTVATTSVDATGSIRRIKKSSSGAVEGVSRTLSRSLDSRRSSSNSKKAVPSPSASSTPAKAPASLSDTNKPGEPPSAESQAEAASSNKKHNTSLDIRPTANGPNAPPQLLATGSNLEVRPSSSSLPPPSYHTIDDLLGP